MASQLSLSEVFRIAEDIEANGYDFYTQSAAAADDKQVKVVLADLGQKELAHKELFSTLRGELCGRDDLHWVDPDGTAELYLKAVADNHVFNLDKKVSELVASIQSSESALRLAIGFEKDTVVFFSALKNAVPEKHKAKVDLLIKEELNHICQLDEALKQLD